MFSFNLKKIKCQKYFEKIDKLSQSLVKIKTIYQPIKFKQFLLKKIMSAKKYIYITTLYLENDDAGKKILHALYAAKKKRPNLDIKIVLDWHRAQRNRIGSLKKDNNADWYYKISLIYPFIDIPIFGIPVSKIEVFGVLHLKGFLFDNVVIYSGASINNSYLNQHKYYRYDRYHVIQNNSLSISMKNFIDKILIFSPYHQRLNKKNRTNLSKMKKLIKKFRNNLKYANYQFKSDTKKSELKITPIIGFGKKNKLNYLITNLMYTTKKKIIICTPYFNFPKSLIFIINHLLSCNKYVEIIIGDKTANDFYTSPKEPFSFISILPYLYEINLRKFIYKLQKFIENKHLIVRIWKHGNNSYHLKGIWIDNYWQLITGSNLNLRGWKLDLENALLIYDPNQKLKKQKNQELFHIRKHTFIIKSYKELENVKSYPKKVRKTIVNLQRIHFDKIIHRFI
ncbi:MAG: CDP-diacylglycerol--serine O-phosphatidyltransferase [Arsenophonus sp.]|nr:MAG: CDP-diacylglycerol--serine O-phosphatidyltransferase [Arsenophonus sp.]